MPSNSKFIKNSNGDTSVRVVSSAQSVADTDQDSVFCKDSSGNTAIRVVTAQESLPAEQPDSMFTKDTHGNTAIRTVGGGGGSAPVIDELNVTPSTSAQTITAPSGTDGYNPVNVAAVTSAIDANITAGNIKKDVQILGVTGSYEGQTPTGTKQITSNGTHDVAAYASADVQVPTTAPDYYITKSVDANGTLSCSFASPMLNFTGIKKITTCGLYHAYYNGRFAGEVVFPDLEEVNGYYACCGVFSTYNNSFTYSSVSRVSCPKLKKIIGTYAFSGFAASNNAQLAIEFPELELINGDYAFSNYVFGYNVSGNISFPKLKKVAGRQAMDRAFAQSTAVKSISMPLLEIVSGYETLSNTFWLDSSLTSLDMSLPKLHTASGEQCLRSTFSSTNITSFKFSSLKTANGGRQVFWYCFTSCSSLTDIYFPALTTTFNGSYTNVFYSMLSSTTGITVHFPSNLQSVIGSWTDVVNGFGGTNTTVLFDLPATVVLTGADTVVYERNPKDDTQTALAWRVSSYDADGFVVDWTSYYTSGTTDPAVGGTIYSDAAFTTAVTTISSIS